MMPSTSLRRASGSMRSRPDTISPFSQPSYAESRKKKFSSSVHSDGRS